MLADLSVYGFAFIAGILSALSPCVLPLLPILAGTALSTHRYGPIALAFGLALSFTLIGLLLATLGSVIGLDAEALRHAAALLLMVFGVVLLSERLQQGFAMVTAKLGGVGQSWQENIVADNLFGQCLLGMVLGVVWSPCVGPTLGATITLAGQGQSLGNAAVVMALFGLGAGLPLVLIGSLSQQAVRRYKQQLSLTGKVGKQLLGGLLLVLGVLMLTSLDKSIEIWLLNHAPEWLIKLSVSI